MSRPPGLRHHARTPAAAALVCSASCLAFVGGASASGLVRSAMAALLLVAVPTARDLARRLSINLLLVVGWLPLLVWAPVGLPGGRMAWAFALITASVVIARVRSPSSIRLIPMITRRHLTILVGPLAAGLSAWPLLAPRPPVRVLSGLMRGWDHAGHFAMYYDQRIAGLPPRLSAGPSDGSGWEFETYAQWVHGLMALTADVLWGGRPGTAVEELGRYAQLNWGVYVLAATLLAATSLAVTAPAGARTSCALTLALSMSVVAAPGTRLILLGYGSFLLVTVAVACTVALVASGQRLAWSTTWVLSAGVVASSAWLLLLPLTATVAAFHVWGRVTGASARERLLVLAVGLATAVPVAVVVVSSAGASSALNFIGEVTRPHPAAVVTMLGLALATAAMALRASLGHRRARRPAMVAAVALVALAELAALGAYQLLTIGYLEYYWWKLGTATTVIAAVLLTFQLAHLRPPRRIGARVRQRDWPIVPATCAVVALVGLGVGDLDIPAPTPAWLVSLPSALDDLRSLAQRAL